MGGEKGKLKFLSGKGKKRRFSLSLLERRKKGEMGVSFPFL